MLPNSNHPPAAGAELAGDAAVASHVVLALLVPEGAIGLGAGVALRAAVPETAVHENCDLLLREGEVGLAGQGQMPTPAGDSF